MGRASELARRTRIFRRRRRRKAAGATMSVMDHLGELRTRLIISGAAFLAISIVAFFFYEPLVEFLRRPLCSVNPKLLGSQGCDLVYLKLLGAFNFRLKLTALVGIALSSPIWLYEIWAFVTPALTTRERRYAVPFLFTSMKVAIAASLVGAIVGEAIDLSHRVHAHPEIAFEERMANLEGGCGAVAFASGIAAQAAAIERVAVRRGPHALVGRPERLLVALAHH